MNCKSTTWQNRRGFTLVELAVSLVILSLISLMFITRTTYPLQKARTAAFVDQLLMLDAECRSSAQVGSQTVFIEIAPRDRGVYRLGSDGLRRRSLRLPACVDSMGITTDGAWRADETTIRVALNGQSPSYAIKLKLRAGPIRYVGVVGGTGQAIVFEDERLVDALFQ